MFKFFRNIRKTLILSGSTKRYILYGIGEITLVVIGILIALQINNWNEWRKDRLQETEILQSLKDNFELNIQTLELDIKRLEHFNQSAKIVVNVLDNKLPFVDSLGAHFHRARIPKYQLSISLSGYEQYKNSGYDIILDDELKKEVINYFESALPKWQTRYNQVNLINESFVDYHVPLFSYDNGTLKPIDINSLNTDQYFMGWLKAYMGGRVSLTEMENNLITETKKILDLINSELEKRD